MLAAHRLSSSIRLVMPTIRVHPLLLLIGGLLLALLVSVSGAILTGKATMSSPEDFLNAYADLLPGQSSAALQNYTCHVPQYIQTVLIEGKFYCEIYVEEGPVRQVNISGIGETIDIFSISLRHSDLTSGDLTHWWGTPDEVVVRRPYYTMHWQNGVKIVGRTDTWSPYQSGVLFISFHNLRTVSA